MFCLCSNSANDKILHIRNNKSWKKNKIKNARILHFDSQNKNYKEYKYPNVEVIFYDKCDKDFVWLNTYQEFLKLKRVYTNCELPGMIFSHLSNDVLIIILDDGYPNFGWGSNIKKVSKNEFNQLWKNDITSVENEELLEPITKDESSSKSSD